MIKTKIILTKSQSILEYLIVLTAIIIAILANTVGLRNGIQNNLNANQQTLGQEAKGTEAPTEVKSADYYASSKTRTDSRWTQNIDTYNNTGYKKEYYFHEGESDMSYVPADGAVLDQDNSYVAPAPAGADWGPQAGAQ